MGKANGSEGRHRVVRGMTGVVGSEFTVLLLSGGAHALGDDTISTMLTR